MRSICDTPQPRATRSKTRRVRQQRDIAYSLIASSNAYYCYYSIRHDRNKSTSLIKRRQICKPAPGVRYPLNNEVGAEYFTVVHATSSRHQPRPQLRVAETLLAIKYTISECDLAAFIGSWSNAIFHYISAFIFIIKNHRLSNIYSTREKPASTT